MKPVQIRDYILHERAGKGPGSSALRAKAVVLLGSRNALGGGSSRKTLPKAGGGEVYLKLVCNPASS